MGGLNQYQYCPNPVEWIDPLGLVCKDGESTSELEAPKTAAQLRNSPGTAYGQGVDVGDNWLKGSHGNAGLTPKQVADKLRGQSFNSFDDFRQAYWKAVADIPELASQFSQRNITRMSNGNSPFTHPTQSVGGRGVYELHHRTPINQGGAVYTVDNIMVTSPRYHKEVLDPIYHFSR